jgi:O-acetyl-ADP-ribose deacetylase
MKVLIGHGSVELVQGDITRQAVDAIVNAANAELAGGGGVDGAIHRAAGPGVMEETQARYPLGCPTGDVVATSAGRLAAKFVFHAVGPIWRGGREHEGDQLRSVHRRAMQLAVKHDCMSIAFPAISTGVYRYPVDLAAEHSLDEVRTFLFAHPVPLAVRFVLFDAGTYAAFARVLDTYAVTLSSQSPIRDATTARG